MKLNNIIKNVRTYKERLETIIRFSIVNLSKKDYLSLLKEFDKLYTEHSDLFITKILELEVEDTLKECKRFDLTVTFLIARIEEYKKSNDKLEVDSVCKDVLRNLFIDSVGWYDESYDLAFQIIKLKFWYEGISLKNAYDYYFKVKSKLENAIYYNKKYYDEELLFNRGSRPDPLDNFLDKNREDIINTISDSTLSAPEKIKRISNLFPVKNEDIYFISESFKNAPIKKLTEYKNSSRNYYRYDEGKGSLEFEYEKGFHDWKYLIGKTFNSVGLQTGDQSESHERSLIGSGPKVIFKKDSDAKDEGRYLSHDYIDRYDVSSIKLTDIKGDISSLENSVITSVNPTWIYAVMNSVCSDYLGLQYLIVNGWHYYEVTSEKGTVGFCFEVGYYFINPYI